MTSRFVHLFKKNDLDEQKAFQRRAHALLSERYSERIFTLTEDPLTLEADGTILGLTNLRSNFLLSSQTERDLQELLEAQFDAVFKETEQFDREDLDWNDAKERLMPQLMPAGFLEKMDLVHFAFGDEVILGFVIDSEGAYSYVREEDLLRWEIDKSEIRLISLSNLSESSRGIEMNAFPGENGLFVVNTMDGYDAVRVLDLKLQELVGEHIGSPFYFGVPNRDFLICWSKNDDLEFQNQMRSQISTDFDERPYPLSGNTFEVSNGNINLAVFVDSDSRTLSAENN